MGSAASRGRYRPSRARSAEGKIRLRIYQSAIHTSAALKAYVRPRKRNREKRDKNAASMRVGVSSKNSATARIAAFFTVVAATTKGARPRPCITTGLFKNSRSRLTRLATSSGMADKI